MIRGVMFNTDSAVWVCPFGVESLVFIVIEPHGKEQGIEAHDGGHHPAHEGD
jgi:hypothetical protein